MSQKSWTVAALAALLCVVLPVRAVAGSFPVTNNNDSGPGSLRAAITSANTSTATPNTIPFQTGQTTILLSSALPAVTVTAAFTGGVGATIDGGVNGNFRIFTIAAGANVTMSNLTITHGHASADQTVGDSFDGATQSPTATAAAAGGGIVNLGSLTLTDCIVTACAAVGVQPPPSTAVGLGGPGAFGGGIFNAGWLTLTRVQFGNNTAQGAQGQQGASGFQGGGGGGAMGAAVFNQKGVVSGDQCVFTGNAATGGRGNGGGSPNGGVAGGSGAGMGGGVFNYRGAVLMSRSTFTMNGAVGGLGVTTYNIQPMPVAPAFAFFGTGGGGGPAGFGGGGAIDFVAGFGGGGAALSLSGTDGPLTQAGWGGGQGSGPSNATSGNGAGLGGALFNCAGAVSLTSCTIDQNAADTGSVSGFPNVGAALGAGFFNLNGSVATLFCTETRNAFNNRGTGPFGLASSVAGFAYGFGVSPAPTQVAGADYHRGDDSTFTVNASDQLTAGPGTTMRFVPAGKASVFARDVVAAQSVNGTSPVSDSVIDGPVALSGNNIFVQRLAPFLGSGASGSISPIFGSADPQLGPLQQNGGSTGVLTRVPLPDSPLVNAGSNADASSIPTDERSQPRIQDGTVDIGATEVQTPSILNVNEVMIQNQPHSFALAEFTSQYSQSDGYPLGTLSLSPPAAGNGTLTLNGTTLSVPVTVTVANFSTLVYSPPVPGVQDVSSAYPFQWSASPATVTSRLFAASRLVNMQVTHVQPSLVEVDAPYALPSINAASPGTSAPVASTPIQVQTLLPASLVQLHVNPAPSTGGDYGIAVVFPGDTSHGSWQYSTDGGTTWNDFNAGQAPSDANAFLLRRTAQLRFVLNPGFPANGLNPFSGTIFGPEFRVWDLASDTTPNALNTPPVINENPFDPRGAFSTGFGFLSVNVNPTVDAGASLVLSLTTSGVQNPVSVTIPQVMASTGAVFTAGIGGNPGTLTWTPPQSTAGQSFNVSFTVTDPLTSQNVTTTVTITVVNTLGQLATDLQSLLTTVSAMSTAAGGPFTGAAPARNALMKRAFLGNVTHAQWLFAHGRPADGLRAMQSASILVDVRGYFRAAGPIDARIAAILADENALFNPQGTFVLLN